MSLLKSHPKIYCHGEVFHLNPAERLRHTGAEWKAGHDLAAFAGRPLKLAYSVLEDTPVSDGVTCIGFKLFKHQQPKVAAALAGDPSVKKILLERTNRLAGFSSNVLARKTGVWNLPPDEMRTAPDKTRIAFDREQFLHFVARQESIFAEYRDLSEGAVAHLRYEDLGRAAIWGLLAFLDVPQAELRPGKAKLNGTDILGRFAPDDREAVLKTLDEIGQPGWVREDVEPWCA